MFSVSVWIEYNKINTLIFIQILMSVNTNYCIKRQKLVVFPK